MKPVGLKNSSPFWTQNYPTKTPHEIPPLSHTCLGDFFSQTVQKYKNKECFSSMGTSLSYKKINQHVEHLASFLQNHLKLKKGDKIAIQLPNCLAYPVSVFASLQAGLTVVNINPLYTENEMKLQFNKSEVKAVVIFSNNIEKLEKVIKKTQIQHVLVVSPDTLLSFPKAIAVDVISRIQQLKPLFHTGYIDFEEALKQGEEHTFQKLHIGLDDIAFIQFTGGTTGTPKAVLLSHRNILSNVRQISYLMKTPLLKDGEEVAMLPLPLYHIYSLTVQFILLEKGFKLALIIDPRKLDTVVKLFHKEKISIFFGINTLFNALNNSPEFQNLKLKYLKISIAGGMALNKTVADSWCKLTKTHIYEGYGLTETSPVVCLNPFHKKPVYGSIGVPMPSTEIKLMGSDLKEVGSKKPGEIWIRGPQVMQGYYKNSEATKQIFHKGWLRTGDVGAFDEKGYLYIVDRIKDMIIVSGFNVYPNEVEAAVMTHKSVLEAAAVGVKSQKTGEAIKLFVALKKDKKTSPEDLVQHCRKLLTNYKIPKIIEFRDSLPKNPAGKILRRALKDEELKTKKA